MDRILPPDLAEIVRAQVKSGRFNTADDVVSAAILLLEEQFPASGNPAQAGAVYELAKLRGVHTILQNAKLDRDFILNLLARQREINHPEAILQTTAEIVGERLGANRTGFFTMADDNTVRFGACWTDGSVRGLHEVIDAAELGEGVNMLLREGEEVVTADCRTDPAVNAAFFNEISAVAMICVPVCRNRKWAGGFYVNFHEPRPWTTAEVILAREVAELTWDAVERANLLEQLRIEIGRQRGELVTAADDLRAETAHRIAAEGQIGQMQRMELVGQLAGGIAHDFNNMLAVVIGAMNLLQRRLARGETDVGRYIEAATDGANRAATLTQRLLAFSRRQPLSPEPIDVDRMIGGMEDMLNRTLGEAIQIETVMAAGLWTTRADPNQLENAILNLAVNARDAMPDGGRLTVETANVHVDEAYARNNEMAQGQYVQVVVTDTGEGMAPDVLERVFEPFYTTKPVGKGTGLGLSQVFGFVRQSEGTVKVYSEIGHGTSVKIYLPRYYGSAEPVSAGRGDTMEISRGDPSEIILVVEDEDRVRMISVGALRDLGYTVLHASSGTEALKILATGQDVTLLFTDIVMPEMTGRVLADKAAETRPGLKVLYTTGYTRNAVVHNGVLDPGTNFLPKPFSIERLANVVRAVLDKPK